MRQLLTVGWFVLNLAIAEGQIHNHDDFECGTSESMRLRSSVAVAGGYSAYGNPFTPKGDLRILIICAGFGPAYDSQSVNGWDSSPDALPARLTNGSLLYSDYTQFTSDPSLSDINNISAYYYAMSRGQFRLVADVYPKRINITPEDEGWWNVSKKVIQQMKTEDPDFDWSRYDNRKNSPGYLWDNTNTLPDKHPDFVVIIYRYARSFSKQPYPDFPPGDAIEEVHLSSIDDYNGYTFKNMQCGFTQYTGGSDMFALFIHEMAHVVYDAPHVSYANAVIGDYFYGETGWSQMGPSLAPFVSSNAWERWYLDWIDGIKANGVDADIKTAQDLNQTGEYILRDFITTGDVIRIKIPNGRGESQYLWLENHQGKSVFDNPSITKDMCNNNLPSSPRGVVAFIESINDDKNTPGDLMIAKANGIKFLHAAGNYDYSFPDQPDASGCWWGNDIYNFHRSEINPISGQNGSQRIKSDFNKNNAIDVDGHWNSVSALSRSDDKYFIRREGIDVYEFMNGEQAFSAGRMLSMASNPCLINRPAYDGHHQTMGVYYLNGISVSILSYSEGNAKIKVRFKDVDISNDTRYAGVIYLPDITADADPDISIQPGYTLRIDKSGTPNRKTKTVNGDFVDLTEFRCQPNASFKQDNQSTVIVENTSTLVIEKNATYIINPDARLTIKTGSNLMVNWGANLIIKNSGQFSVEKGSVFSAEKGATIAIGN